MSSLKYQRVLNYLAFSMVFPVNGCFQDMRGSHKLGLIEHGIFCTQAGADPERVVLAAEHLDHVYCEMEPGTALFFHANLLHRSDKNESDDPRLVFI